MKRFKGTPGEWKFSSMCEECVNIETKYMVICKDIIEDIDGDIDNSTKNIMIAEQRANYLLMSKSPRMLKSLIDLIKKTEAAMLMAGYKQQDIDGCLYKYNELIKEATEI